MDIQNFLLKILNMVNTYFTDFITVVLLVGCGIYFTFKTDFVQIRCFKEGFKRSLGGLFSKTNRSKSSSFSALATAVAAQIGVGNIVGTASAILIGGPGAIFWMWIAAFFGMATVYAEAVAAQLTRKYKKDGKVTGGAVYYIRAAFKGKTGVIISKLFAFSVILSLGFIGSAIQSNAVAETVNSALHIPQGLIGIFLSVLCGVVFLGGADRIVAFAEKIVPIMAGAFIFVCLVILLVRVKYIPQTFSLIFKGALLPSSIIGGGTGYAFKRTFSQGVKKGLFSNEAGMGSTPYAHALAEVEKPHDQGVVAMMGVFIDTFVILTLTAIVMISVLYADGTNMYINFGIDESNMMIISMSSVLGEWIGKILTAVSLFFFGFASILGWNLFGKINSEYLFGSKANGLYYLISVIFILFGSLVKSDFLWSIADVLNNLMIIPNIFSLFLLSKSIKTASNFVKINKKCPK